MRIKPSPKHGCRSERASCEWFQRRLDGAGERVDHSTAGAQEAVRSATKPDDQIIAYVIAHAIAEHHSGLPDSLGDAAGLDERLKRKVDALDPAWRREIAPVASDLTPNAMNSGDRQSLAYRLAFFGRMVFSCLVDADFRDTEDFYCAAEGRSVDREWPSLLNIVGELIGRLDAVPQPLLHRRIAFPIRDSDQEHQVLALAPSRKDWHSVRKRA